MRVWRCSCFRLFAIALKQSEISDKLDYVITQFYKIISHSISKSAKKTELKHTNLLKQLSKRELQALKLFLQGYTISQVADVIHLSPRTIEMYLQKLKEKLHCESKSELIMKAIERNWLAINL